MKNEKTISLLIGAGFSVPAGYPSGSKLNQLIQNCDGSQFSFDTSGVLAVTNDGKKPDWGFPTSYDIEFDFFREMVNYYTSIKSEFDYEEFWDYIHKEAKKDSHVDVFAKPFLNAHTHQTKNHLLHGLENIFSQLIEYYLKDGNGNTWYDNSPHLGKPIFPGYTGILNCLESFGKTNVVNIHSLNHDLFFERLNWTAWISGELCDGFEELGSPYYGELDYNSRKYHVRLSRYTGKYDKKFRLYKLHGSRDYGIYYTAHGGDIANPENYLKTRCGIGFGNLYKEITNQNGELDYEHCWVNYHSDFLTGTTSKIERYDEDTLYKALFQLFRYNLQEADKLVIVGYGGRDSEINQMIFDNFDYSNKPSFIVNPFPGQEVMALKDKLSSTLITTSLGDLNIAEFN